MTKLSKLASLALLMPLMAACGTTGADDGGNGGNGGNGTDVTLSGAATGVLDGAQYLTTAMGEIGVSVSSLAGDLLGENGVPTGTYDTDFLDATASYTYIANPGDVLGADYTSVEFYNVIDGDNNAIYTGYHGIATETTDIPSENVALYDGVWVGQTLIVNTINDEDAVDHGVIFGTPINRIEGGTAAITADFAAGTMGVVLVDTSDTGSDYDTITLSNLAISGNAFASNSITVFNATGRDAAYVWHQSIPTSRLDAGGHFYGTDDALTLTAADDTTSTGTGPDEVAGGFTQSVIYSLVAELDGVERNALSTGTLTGVFFGD